MTSGCRRRTARTTALFSIGAGLVLCLVAWAGPAFGQDYTSGITESGTTLTATYGATGGGTFLVGGVQLPADQLSRVSSATCSNGGTVNLTGAPRGGPECIWNAPQTTATITIIGSSPWTTMTVQYFWSPTGRAADYAFGPTFTVSPSAATTQPPATITTEPPTRGPSTTDSSSDLTPLWAGLTALGAGTAAGNFWLHTDKKDSDDDEPDDDELRFRLQNLRGEQHPGLTPADEAAAASAMDDDVLPIAGDGAKPPDEVM